MATFKSAFADARKRLGPGKTFTWNGKQYSTDRADDKKPAPKASSSKSSSPSANAARAKASEPAAGRSRTPAKASNYEPSMAAASARSGASRSVQNKNKKPATPTAASAPKPKLQGLARIVGALKGMTASGRAKEAAMATACKKNKGK